MTLELQNFAGRVALVTGSGSGLGRCIALAFARRAASVAVVDLNMERAEATATECREIGVDAQAFQTDVADPADAEAMVAGVVERFGRLDAACNNAAINGPFAKTHEHTIEGWRRTVEVDLSSVFYCMRPEITYMLGAGGGTIVNTSSMNGHVGTTLSSAYTAAKHGVIGLTKAAAMEYARRGIRINALCPGWMDTPMTRNDATAETGIDVLGYAAKVVPFGRAARPEEVAEGAVWLASDAASYMTGQSLVIDGGFCAG